MGDRFVIERQVGEGGMGAVYRATDARTGGAVALKIIKGSAERWEREADVLARLDHPAIVRHVAHGRTDDGEPFVAMEWLDGEDLERRLARGPLGPADALALARVVAGALAAVHARGVVHRDIKPSNVFLVEGRIDRPVVLDFGVARAVDAARVTITGQVVGTPQYMAPEQVKGVRDVDARADVFALGALLFECASGRPPFVGETAVAVLAKILLEEPPPLRAVCPSASRDLEDVVRRALAKAREDRHADAAELLADLARVDSDEVGAAATVRRAPTPSALGTHERRLVCVVIAGDRGGLAEGARAAPPGDLATARAVAHAHGARVAPVGSGYLVATVPGAGVAMDQARRAARYALALASEIPSLSVAVAMGWGRIDPVPVGEAIDRAVALLRAGSARPRCVRVDDVGAGLLDAGFAISSDEHGYVIVSERQVAERPRTLLGRATPCVGRERELGVLAGLFEEVCAERVARAALVTAPAGAGKSRVRHELVDRISRRDPPPSVWLARAEMLRAGSPLDLLARCVRAMASIEEAEPASTVQERLRARVRLRVPPPRRADAAEFLAEIVGAPLPPGSNPRLDAARGDARLMGDQMLRAWLTLLGAECAVRPVVLVLEDLHWGDPQTVRFLDAALRELAELPLFVVAVARGDVHDRFPGLWRDRPVQEVRLGALSARACERLVRDVLGDIDAARLGRIVRHAEGNALFLEEMIRAYAAGRADTAPASVVAMLQARIEALDADTRRVLRAASVFGESCDRAALAALLGDGVVLDVDGALARLVESEVVVRRGDDAGGREYAFRHALMREAAYATLTEEDRRLAHRVAAGWLEANGERDALLLAGHYEAAGETPDAARCWADAALQAFEKSDFDAALARAARSLELGVRLDARRTALTARGRTLACIGRLADAQRDFEAALAITGEATLRVELLRDLWNVGVLRQDVGVLRAAGQEALTHARSAQRPDLAAEATAALALADHAEGKCEEAVVGYLAACDAHRGRPSVVVGTSAIMLYHVAMFDEALKWNDHFLRLALDIGDWPTVSDLHGNVGLALAATGRYVEADERFAAARDVAARYALTTALARAMSVSVGWRLDVFDLDGAAAAAREVLGIARELDFALPRVCATLDLAAVALRSGDLGEAARQLDAVRGAVAHGTGFHGWLWRCRDAVYRAELALETRSPAEAARAASEAVDRCVAVRRVKYAVAARSTLARALTALGRQEQARAALAHAAADAERCGDPAMILRAKLAALECGDASALADAARQAARIEAALPPASRAAFRAARALRTLG